MKDNGESLEAWLMRDRESAQGQRGGESLGYGGCLLLMLIVLTILLIWYVGGGMG